MNSVDKVLKKLKEDVEKGEVKLSPINITLLNNQIENLGYSIETAEAQFDISREDLKRFIGFRPPNLMVELVRIIKEIGEEDKRHHSIFENGDHRAGSEWPGLDWQEIEKQFSIPETPKDAIQIAMKSPSIVIADLGGDMAKNQWYMAVAANAPAISFSFSRSFGHTESGPVSPLAVDSTTNVYAVNVGMSINGGTALNITSNGILQEAAKLNRKASELQMINSIEDAYLTLKSTKVGLKSAERLLKANLKALSKIEKIQDSNLSDVLRIFDQVSASLRGLSDQLSSYLKLKATILSMDGDLLSEIVKKQKESKK